MERRELECGVVDGQDDIGALDGCELGRDVSVARVERACLYARAAGRKGTIVKS